MQGRVSRLVAFALLASGLLPASQHLSKGSIAPLVAWICGLLLGLFLIKGSLCFAAAVRDPLMTGDTGQTRAMILAIGLATPVFAVIQRYGSPEGSGLLGNVFQVGPQTVVGGLLFGFGMVIAGGCASGTIVRAGDGFVQQWVGLIGLAVGSVVGSWHWNWWYPEVISKTRAIHLGGTDWARAAALQTTALLALYALLSFIEWKRYGESGVELYPRISELRQIRLGDTWPMWLCAIGLATVNSVLFALTGKPWGITGEFTGVFARLTSSVYPSAGVETWTYFRTAGAALLVGDLLSRPALYVLGGMFSGAMATSLLTGQFRLRIARKSSAYVMALVGGMAMGYGARLSQGCAVGAVISGVPSMSLHSWVFLAALIPGAFAGGRVTLAIWSRELHHNQTPRVTQAPRVVTRLLSRTDASTVS